MYYVYLVRCKDHSLYCGQTNNLKKRIVTHNSCNSQSAKYTRGRAPVVLVYFEKKKTLSLALKRECEIKKMTKKQKELLTLKEMK